MSLPFDTDDTLRRYYVSTESCKKALGLESGIVGNDQLTAFSAYQNDFTTFGAHRARLNLKDWPPGYRASPVESSKLPWLRVDLRKDLVITGIATQGYGNASVAEWVTSYRLMFAKGAEFRNFVDVNGDVLVSPQQLSLSSFPVNATFLNIF